MKTRLLLGALAATVLVSGTDASLFTQSGRTLSASLRYTFVGI